jgi:integrase
MAAKVVWYRNAWWVRTHAQGKKRDRKIGPSKADKRQAGKIAEKINAALALGTYRSANHREKHLPCRQALLGWHKAYAPTFKSSFETESKRIIDAHLVPFFGANDLTEIRESDLLNYIGAKLEAKLAPITIQTHLSILRRVLSLAQREGRIDRNPASNLGELMRRVDRRTAYEAKQADSWTREEVSKLLKLAKQHEPRFYPALVVLFSTGLRRGELLGLKWEDVDFERRQLNVRRAVVRGEVTSPKSGRGRYVALSPGLGSLLLELLAQRRRESLAQGWPEVPEWVFPSETGKPPSTRTISSAPGAA